MEQQPAIRVGEYGDWFQIGDNDRKMWISQPGIPQALSHTERIGRARDIALAYCKENEAGEDIKFTFYNQNYGHVTHIFSNGTSSYKEGPLSISALCIASHFSDRLAPQPSAPDIPGIARVHGEAGKNNAEYTCYANALLQIIFDHYPEGLNIHVNDDELQPEARNVFYALREIEIWFRGIEKGLISGPVPAKMVTNFLQACQKLADVSGEEWDNLKQGRDPIELYDLLNIHKILSTDNCNPLAPLQSQDLETEGNLPYLLLDTTIQNNEGKSDPTDLIARQISLMNEAQSLPFVIPVFIPARRDNFNAYISTVRSNFDDSGRQYQLSSALIHSVDGSHYFTLRWFGGDDWCVIDDARRVKITSEQAYDLLDNHSRLVQYKLFDPAEDLDEES